MALRAVSASAAGVDVTSIAGTANQITASAATGAVTLSTPAAFIAPGSVAVTGAAAGAFSTTGAGIRLAGSALTRTDSTTGAGTLATSAGDYFGAITFATAANAITITDCFNSYFVAPVNGANVTITNKWALGADSLKVGTSGVFQVSAAGILTTTSPVLTTPTLGVATATSLAIGGATIGSNGLAVTGHLLLEGVTSTGATGTGNLVFSASPTLTGTALASVLTASGLITGATTASGNQYDAVPTTNTNAASYRAANTGGQFYVGLDSSTGSVFGAGAYGAVVYNGANTPLIIFTNATARVTVSAAGAVRFNTGYGAGTATFDASGNITSVSDATLKDVVGPFRRGLADVCKIDTSRWHWTEKSGLDGRDEMASFTAQAVEEGVPEAVFKNEFGLRTIYDRTLIAASINALKELNQRVSRLEGRS